MAGDEGFREIHLSGKHLVFLFMAITVVGVVIFLCGVMVGRGVRNSTAVTAAVEPAPSPGGGGEVVPPADAQAQAKATPPPALPATPPPTPAEEASPQPSGGAAKKAQPSAPPAQTAPAAAPAKPEGTPAAAGTAKPSEPARDGWAVQVTAPRDRAQAEAIVKRLVTKGYSAYLLEPPPGSPVLYRVRVGKFKDRREAEAAMRRLEKEEKFQPFITR
jgi:cell division septation protein DedD